MAGRTKTFITNSLFMALKQLAMMAAAFIIPRILIVNYGSDINGLIVSASQFIVYFALVEAGISGASIFALYKPLADKDYPKVNAILSAAKKFYMQSGYLFLSLVFLLAVLYPFIVNNSSLAAWQISLIVFALGFSGTLDFFTLSKYVVLLTADQRSYVIAIAQIAYWTLNTLLVFVLAKFKVNIVILEYVIILAILARSLILWLYTHKKYKFLDYTVPPDLLSIKERWNVLYLQILGGTHISIPIIIATVFLPLKEVSVYGVYNMVLSGINGILNIFCSGLAAGFGEVLAKKEHTVLKRATQEFEQSYYIMISIVYSTAILLIVPFVTIYTKGITDADYILPVFGFMFALNGFLYNLKTPQGMLVISAGMYRQTRVQSSIQAAISCFGALIGVQFLGLYGILAGLIAANIYRDIDLLFFVPKNITNMHYKHSLSHITAALISLLPSIIAFFYLTLNINNVKNWILYACIVTAFNLIWSLLVNFIIDRENMLRIFKRILSLLKRRKK